ncbi:hypothetical protein [Streptomyces zhihengii]
MENHGNPRLPGGVRVRGGHDYLAVPLLAAAVRFGHPAVAAVVVGARTAAEVEQSAAWLAHPVPAELWAEARRSGLLRAGCPAPPPG